MDTDFCWILFADIKGYSSLTPQALRRFHEKPMAKLAQLLSDDWCIYCNTWGDAVVVGSKQVRPLANFALEMRDFFRAYDWLADELPKLDVRISLHGGDILRGDDPFTKRGLVIGHTVVLAARVEPITLPGQVWITRQALTGIEGADSGKDKRFGTDALGEVSLAKGYGVHELFLLRRSDEPPLDEHSKAQIRQENERRTDAGKALVGAREKGTFTVVVGVVVNDDKVVLVKRRNNHEGLHWMFPSGTLLPLQEPEQTIWREVKEETNLSCVVVEKIGERLHPTTDVQCEYFLLEPVGSTELVNADPLENDAAAWVPISEVHRYVGNSMFDSVKDKLLKLTSG